MTLDIVVTEIAGFDGSVAGGDVPVVRVLDQLVHGDLSCGDRERGILRDPRGIVFDEFVELVCGYDKVDPTDRFRFFGRVIAT